MSYPCLVPEGQQPIQIQTKVFTIGKLEKNLLRIDVLLSTSTVAPLSFQATCGDIGLGQGLHPG